MIFGVRFSLVLGIISPPGSAFPQDLAIVLTVPVRHAPQMIIARQVDLVLSMVTYTFLLFSLRRSGSAKLFRGNQLPLNEKGMIGGYLRCSNMTV